MQSPKALSVAVALALVNGLTGCAPQPTTTPGADTDANSTFRIAPGEQRYVIDDSASELHVYTYRGGKLARFGHNHVLNARQLRGDVALTDGIVGSRFHLRVPLASIEVDNPNLRAAAGVKFNSKPSPEDVAATRTNMLGHDGLDVAVAPAALIQGEVLNLNTKVAILSVRVTIREKIHRQNINIKVTTHTESILVSGAMSLKHSDFGITPFSVMLGALTVKDKVDIRFELVARLAT